jgi:hypothetical protein
VNHPIILNMNDSVTVQLEPHGLERLVEHHTETAELIEAITQKPHKVYQETPDEYGNYNFTLWSLIEIFHPMIGIGLEPPFTDNEVCVIPSRSSPWIDINKKFPPKDGSMILLKTPIGVVSGHYVDGIFSCWGDTLIIQVASVTSWMHEIKEKK